jgi:hypothetical protein
LRPPSAQFFLTQQIDVAHRQFVTRWFELDLSEGRGLQSGDERLSGEGAF